MTKYSHPFQIAGLAVCLALLPAPAMAGDHEEGSVCFILCAPELNLEPTFTVDNLIAPARLQDTTTKEISSGEREAAFEIVLALDIPTANPYIGTTLEAIFTFGDHNALEFEAELNFNVILKDWTRGWFGAHFDIIMKFSPRETPGGSSAYTPKLNLELDMGLYPFNGQPSGNWLRGVSLEASLDYVATGLPRKGDVVDGELYLDDASGWSVSFLLVLPVAPVFR